MRHSWDEAKLPAVKHPADIAARGRVSGRGAGVLLSAQTRSGCRETLTDVRAQVALCLYADFENFTTFKPHEQHDKAVHLMADEVIAGAEH
jgi:hypothetical protein